MSAAYERGLPPEHAVFQLGEVSKRIALSDLYQSLNIQTIVRITESPSRLSKKHSIVGHIGLPVAEEAGMRVLIARIYQSGYYNEKESRERLPILSLTSACLGELSRVIQRASFEELPEEVFEHHVVGGINRDNILDKLKARYRHSHGLSTNEIWEQGFSYRSIPITRKLKKSEITHIWCKIPSVDAE
jgi:hypothetical protein